MRIYSIYSGLSGEFILEELKSVIREKNEDFLREAKCPECDTILLWFEPGAVFGARILTALCSKCGIFYQVRIDKKWVKSDPCRCLNCACCCIEPERLRKFV